MRKCLVLGLVATLSGCAATSTQDLMNRGKLTAFSSAKTPPAVAECLARNSDDIGIPSRIRPGQDAGGVEVSMQNNAFFVRAIPRGSGSDVQVWTSPAIQFNVRDYTAQLIAGC